MGGEGGGGNWQNRSDVIISIHNGKAQLSDVLHADICTFLIIITALEK